MVILDNQICFPATRQPDGHFRNLCSCTFLTEDFPETGSKLPGCRDFIPAEGEHVVITFWPPSANESRQGAGL
jgi:hypothetical protein